MKRCYEGCTYKRIQEGKKLSEEKYVKCLRFTVNVRGGEFVEK